MTTDDRYDMPIKGLGLSPRAYNVLNRNGLTTVGAILTKSDDELLALRNLGRRAFDEIKGKLSDLGL
jgi:DNA-directed RNA polymerase subunit alpha